MSVRAFGARGRKKIAGMGCRYEGLLELMRPQVTPRPTTECNQVSFAFHPEFPIDVRIDAPETSSDGGWLLLRQADERLGISEWIAAALPDERDPSRIEHD